jgi:hypothetical protein
MPAVKKQQKPKPSTKEPSTKEASVKSDPSHQVVLSKNAGGNISDYSVEFTKDSK